MPLNRHKPRPTDTLGQWMDQRVQSLRSLVRSALESFDVEAIHQARVATRRLRAALDLVSPLIPTDDKDDCRLRNSLRRIRKRLGPVRDLDVMLAHLAERWAIGRHAAASAWVIRHLAQQRLSLLEKDSRKRPASRLLSELGSWWGVHELINSAEQQLHQTIPADIARQLSAFSECSASLSDPAEGAAPMDPHEVRIAGKRLRYTLEIADALGLHVPRSALKHFKRMQDALGLWHDFAVLAQAILQLTADTQLALHDHAACERAVKLAQTASQRGQQYLAQFITLWKEHGPSITSSLATPTPPPGSNPPEPATHPDGDSPGHDPTTPPSPESDHLA